MMILLSGLYLSAALAGLIAAVILLRHTEVEGGRWLSLMVAGAAFWALCDALELGLPTVDQRRVLSQIQYLGVVVVAPSFLLGALALGLPTWRRSVLRNVAIWAVPLVTLPVAWTSDFHGLLWTSITIPGPVPGPAVYSYGPWFWILFGHSYILLLLGTWILIRTSRRVTRPFRAPFWLLVLVVALPWMGNLAYNLKLGPAPGVNWFSISVLIAGAILAWSVQRTGLLRVLPAGRESLLETLSDGVLVLDRTDRVVYRNPAAEHLLGGSALDFLAACLRPPATGEGDSGTDSPAGGEEAWNMEVRTGAGSSVRWLEVRADAVRDRWNVVAGRFVILRDVTERRRLEDEREELIGRLQDALGEVRALEKLLPACARCRKVRDDAGYWGRLEEYLKKRTAVRFTHHICPTCAGELYGEFATPPADGDDGAGTPPAPVRNGEGQPD